MPKQRTHSTTRPGPDHRSHSAQDDALDGDAFAYLNDTPDAWYAWQREQQHSRPFTRIRTRRSFLALGLTAIVGATLAGVPLGTVGRFYPGTSVGGVDISQQPRDRALAMLQDHFADFENTALDFVYGDQRWNASLAQLGYHIDYEATLNRAFTHGRDQGVVGSYTNMLLTPEKQSFPITFVHDESSLTDFLTGIGTEIIGAARDARLELTDSGVEIIPNVDGQRLDIDAAERNARNQIETAVRGTISLTTVPVVSQVTAADYEPLKAAANTLISAPVFVSLGDSSWTVDEETLRSALRLPAAGQLDAPTLDRETIGAGLSSVADAVYTDPVNAVFGWDNGLYLIEADQHGQEANLEQLLTDVSAAAATTDRRTIRLPMNEVLANARADNMNELGIIDLVAEGSSSYAYSTEARAANVEVSAQHLAHTLIAPGQVVSFNDMLGPISLDRGFVEGKIIKGSWIESDIGGGACQASTTVYRAVLHAGLPISEWHAHLFRLEFYELDGSPPGIDAAIYQPNEAWEAELDLVFTNDTEQYLLLEALTENETAYCRLYGTPQGRDVEITVPYISDPIAPEGPVEREDETLKKNERVKVQSAAPGYDVQMVRAVTEHGVETINEEYWSQYAPVRETWMIGPGTKRQFPTPEA